jgi:hypothetical protein
VVDGDVCATNLWANGGAMKPASRTRKGLKVRDIEAMDEPLIRMI